MKEEWRKLNNHQNYLISSLGRIKNISTGKIYIGQQNNKGYTRFDLCENGKRFVIHGHKAVAEAFIPKIEGKTYINHIDGCKTNNNVNNLEWCTPRENIIHARDILHVNYGSKRMPIYCVETNTIYPSSSYASLMFCNTKKSFALNIWKCCRGYRKTAYGFHWQFVN